MVFWQLFVIQIIQNFVQAEFVWKELKWINGNLLKSCKKRDILRKLLVKETYLGHKLQGIVGLFLEPNSILSIGQFAFNGTNSIGGHCQSNLNHHLSEFLHFWECSHMFFYKDCDRLVEETRHSSPPDQEPHRFFGCY